MTIANIDGKIHLALINHLEGMSGVPGIAKKNEKFDYDADLPYLEVKDVRFDTPRKYTATDDPDEYRGFYMVDVMVPLTWTRIQMLGLINQISTRFSKDRILTQDDVKLQILDTPKPQASAYRDGAYNRQPVKINWTAWG